MLLEINLKNLEIHPQNVRKNVPKEGVEQLAGNIEQVGLINPLRVCEGKKKGDYLVIAGGRRLRALKHLAMVNAKEDPALVPCLLCEGNEIAVSLSENIVRQPLSPVEEFKAFSALSGDRSDKEIAELFHVKQFRVRQRLALGNLAPAILNALEKKEIDLDTAAALTLTTDHKLQRELLKQHCDHHNGAWAIKKILSENTFCARYAEFDLVLYTGEYRDDLFSFGLDNEASDRLLLDIDQALTLQAAAGEAKAKDLLDLGWRWAEFIPEELTWTDREKYDREHLPFNKEEWSQKVMKKTGVLIHYDRDCGFSIHEGYYDVEATQKRRAKAKTGQVEEDVPEVETGSWDTYPTNLKTDIERIATMTLARAASCNSEVMLRMLLAELITEFGTGWSSNLMAINLHTTPGGDLVTQLAEHAVTMGAQKRVEKLKGITDLIGSADGPDKIDTKLKPFSANQIVAALALVAARSITLGPGKKFFDLKEELGFEWRDGWTPDLEFFKRLTKPQCAFILVEIGLDVEYIDGIMAGKRAEVHQYISDLFERPKTMIGQIYDNAGKDIQSEVIDKINNWVPFGMRATED